MSSALDDEKDVVDEKQKYYQKLKEQKSKDEYLNFKSDLVGVTTDKESEFSKEYK